MSADFFLTAPKRFKRAVATKAFTIDLSARLRIPWIAGRAYGAGETSRPSVANGFAFQTGAAGQAGAIEPLWPNILGATVIDGSLTWTAILPGTNALDPITAVAWNLIDNDGFLSVVAPSHTNEEATAAFAGGVPEITYRVQALVTTAAPLVYDIEFDLEVS